MANNITNVLEANESVVWQGKVSRKVLTFVLVFSLIIVFAVGVYFLTKESVNYTSNGQSAQTSGKIVGLIIIVLGLIVSLIKFFADLVKDYAITEKRVLIKSGIIGTDFKSIYFDQIKNIFVDVGLIGKLFGVGSIKIDIGKTQTFSTGSTNDQPARIQTKTMYDVLKHIDNPYDAFKNVQHTLETRKESLYSGRADRESNPEAYKQN
ncbi:MAG: PH domain-containing protein [Bacteroidales bacterium]|nr:PH domain-containing protein [Bacteroidales bacterium]